MSLWVGGSGGHRRRYIRGAGGGALLGKEEKSTCSLVWWEPPCSDEFNDPNPVTAGGRMPAIYSHLGSFRFGITGPLGFLPPGN